MPGKPNKYEEMLMGDKEVLSQRSIHRMDDSTLSRRLSQIPKERAATVLSSSAEGGPSRNHNQENNKNGIVVGGGSQSPTNLISVLNMQGKRSFRSEKSATNSPQKLQSKSSETGGAASRRHSKSSQKSIKSPTFSKIVSTPRMRYE